MRNPVYVLFITEKVEKDEYTGYKLVRDTYEECFTSKNELKNYIDVYKSLGATVERYKGKKSEFDYVYRIIFN